MLRICGSELTRCHSSLSFRPTGEIFRKSRGDLRRAELWQRVLFVILVDYFYRHAEFYLIVRAADDVADQARAFVEIDERNVVRRLAFIGRMPGAMIAHEGVDFAFATERCPFILGRQAVWTRTLRRI